jgi:16S rRNA (cytidine1402-2'-O)-methyltransferase
MWPMPGTLWLVGTPIGNLGDISERARTTLAEADVIACEDTRRTRKLLSALGVTGARLVSFFEGNEERRTPELLAELRDGADVAVVSDAGMPGLSDPGYRLVVAAIGEGIAVDVVPGPSAAVAALVISGLPTDRFVFEGFLPRRRGPRRTRLEELARDTRTVVLYESPRRVGALLADAAAVLGDRPAVVVRELTKAHQEAARGTLAELAARYEEDAPRGEVVVAIGGASADAVPDLEELGARVEELASHGVSRKAAADRVAADAGVSRREVYEASLRQRGRVGAERRGRHPA